MWPSIFLLDKFLNKFFGESSFSEGMEEGSKDIQYVDMIKSIAEEIAEDG